MIAKPKETNTLLDVFNDLNEQGGVYRGGHISIARCNFKKLDGIYGLNFERDLGETYSEYYFPNAKLGEHSYGELKWDDGVFYLWLQLKGSEGRNISLDIYTNSENGPLSRDLRWEEGFDLDQAMQGLATEYYNQVKRTYENIKTTSLDFSEVKAVLNKGNFGSYNIKPVFKKLNELEEAVKNQ